MMVAESGNMPGRRNRSDQVNLIKKTVPLDSEEVRSLPVPVPAPTPAPVPWYLVKIKTQFQRRVSDGDCAVFRFG